MPRPAVLFVFWMVALNAAEPESVVIGFDSDAPGSLPSGWAQAMTKKGSSPRWEVLRDPTAPSAPNVLAQLSVDRMAGRFPLAIYERASIRDGELSVRFKPVSGQVDQAAGVVWRYRDPNNYYIVRANALEDNVVLYKVQNGERISIPPKDMPSRSYGVKHTIPKRSWSELKVVFIRNAATIYLDGAKLFEAEDDTFPDSGKIGLWTKADSVTYFDNFEFRSK